jgi:hypothetical protein
MMIQKFAKIVLKNVKVVIQIFNAIYAVNHIFQIYQIEILQICVNVSKAIIKN